MEGFYVERRFGWDCHGLPVEYEIDKTLGIVGPDDVLRMGIDKYNQECRSIVMRYSTEWETVVKRMGRWIDFCDDYKTMYPWFMESVWWVFSQLYQKGLVYHGVKVMPFSTACNTPLSNFEASQNYKNVQDPSVIVSFPLDDEPGVSLVAWTTTPWTLPSNLALCVHPNFVYTKVKDNANGKIYILMKDLISSIFKKEELYTILEEFPGSSLAGKSYEPLFPFFLPLKSSRGAFRVVTDTYVTSDCGTGVVHQAPYFGEDDFRVCLKFKIIAKDLEPVCPVDASGKFTHPVTDFQSIYVKDADKLIIRKLKENGRLVSQSSFEHSYPFCWRSDTPLIYKAVPTWFIRVEEMRDRLLACNAQTHWVPDFVKEKRFANWLSNARDWAVSRNRFWGTPIPLWVSDDREEVVCVGSREELRRLAGLAPDYPLEDLHREFVDNITIPSSSGRGVLRRIPEVFDCWFESGSMPYAQQHFPFGKNADEFKLGFPADFIAEGIDQTRGWFYTLLVISTALFNQPPFKHLIVNGIVLNAKGEKMSKRLKNYPEPDQVIKTHCADALRMYLINSPVVRAEDMRFKDSGVREVIRDAFLPWYNASRLVLHINLPMWEQRTARSGYRFAVDEPPYSDNVMDQWIVSAVHSLIIFVRQEMNEYRLYTVLPRLVKFVDQLTNWYVRMNRRRMRGAPADVSTNTAATATLDVEEDCRLCLHTAIYVLYHMCVLFASFVPFLTEFLYQRLRVRIIVSAQQADSVKTGSSGSSAPALDSIHFHRLIPDATLISAVRTDIEEKMRGMQIVITLGRQCRDRRALGLRCPLNEIVVIHRDPGFLAGVAELQHYIRDELNVKGIIFESDKSKYGIQLKAMPNLPRLAGRLKKAFKEVGEAIKQLSTAQLEEFLSKGELTICNEVLDSEDLMVMYQMDDKSSTKEVLGKDASKEMKTALQSKQSRYETDSDNQGVLVLLDCERNPRLEMEFLVRELINRIQRLRKSSKLEPSDPIVIGCRTTNKELICALSDDEMTQLIFSVTQQPLVFIDEQLDSPEFAHLAFISSEKIEDLAVTIELRSRADNNSSLPAANVPVAKGILPDNCRRVYIQFVDRSTMSLNSKSRVTILLENPAGQNYLPFSDLRFHASTLFNRPVELYLNLDDVANNIILLRRLSGSENSENYFGENIVKLSELTLYATAY